MRLLVIFGPPAVGKMTVGREIARRSDFRLFHNHALIEPLLHVFDYGTPPFNRLLGEWRARVVEEAAMSGTDLLLTFVWGLELQSDADELGSYIRPYVEQGADVAFVELSADLDTRLQRNRSELGLAEKRSKRDVEWSDANVREMERFVMNTDPHACAGPALPGAVLLAQHRHVRLENGKLTPQEAAARILAWLDERQPPSQQLVALQRAAPANGPEVLVRTASHPRAHEFEGSWRSTSRVTSTGCG